MGEVKTGNILGAYNLNFLGFKSSLQRVRSIYYLTHNLNLKTEDVLTLTTLYSIILSLEWLSAVRSKDLYFGFGLLILEDCFTEIESYVKVNKQRSILNSYIFALKIFS